MEWHLHRTATFLEFASAEATRIARETRVLSEGGSVLLEVYPMRFVVRIKRQLQHVQHLKKKCKLWAPTWQKEMGWVSEAG